MKKFLFAFVILSSVIAHSSASFATQVQEVTSPGGIKAWLVEEHSLPLIAVKVNFVGAGSAYDPKSKEGRASINAAMLMEGAGDMDSNSFNAAVEGHAMALTFGIDEDMFRASLESLSEYRELAFSLLGMALTQPRYDAPALERVRSQAQSILTQQEQEPGYLIRRGWEKAAFPGHPYSNPVMGTKESIAGMTRDDLVLFHKNYLTRQNMIIAVVGDITPKELAQLLDKHLAALPEKYNPDVTVPRVSLPKEGKQVVIEHDIPQTMVLFGEEGIDRSDPDYYAAFVMNQVLGGGGSLTAKLGQEIREKRGLAYAVGTMLDPMQKGNSWRGQFSTRNEKAGEALSVLHKTLQEFAKNGPTDKELLDAKEYLTGSFVLALDSNGDVASYLISMQAYGLGKDYFDKRNSYINAVTKEQVKRVAQRLIDDSRLQVILVGKPNLKVQ